MATEMKQNGILIAGVSPRSHSLSFLLLRILLFAFNLTNQTVNSVDTLQGNQFRLLWIFFWIFFNLFACCLLFYKTLQVETLLLLNYLQYALLYITYNSKNKEKKVIFYYTQTHTRTHTHTHKNTTYVD